MKSKRYTHEDIASLVPGACAYERGQEGDEWLQIVWDEVPERVDYYCDAKTDAPEVEVGMSHHQADMCAEHIAEHMLGESVRMRALFLAGMGSY